MLKKDNDDFIKIKCTIFFFELVKPVGFNVHNWQLLHKVSEH